MNSGPDNDAQEPIFEGADDSLHPPSDDFYETETFWFSFFVPERDLGAWLYSAVKQNAGVSTGGLFVWDKSGVAPWEIPFYEQFSWLKPPTERGPERLSLPNGISITTIEPGMVYDLAHDDRHRVSVRLRFHGLEHPVPLRTGAPPYPKASHYDQTGHVTGHLVLNGERIDVDCFAMRDRSWGSRKERGYQPVCYTWLADANTSLLAFSRPSDDGDEVYAGYLRKDGRVSRVESGRRLVVREPKHGWVTSMRLDAIDEHGDSFSASATAKSRMILPGATNICINTVLEWDVGGVLVHGEDQDVWPLDQWKT